MTLTKNYVKIYQYLAKNGKTEIDGIFLKIKNIIKIECFQKVGFLHFHWQIHKWKINSISHLCFQFKLPLDNPDLYRDEFVSMIMEEVPVIGVSSASAK